MLRFENEAEDLLHYLKSAGMAPGLKGTLAESSGDEVVLQSNGDSVSVTRSVAETVSVRADPSPPPRTALPEQLVLRQRPLRPLGENLGWGLDGGHPLARRRTPSSIWRG